MFILRRHIRLCCAFSFSLFAGLGLLSPVLRQTCPAQHIPSPCSQPAPTASSQPAPTARPPCPPPPSLDYLEIGTSDFGTVVQAVTSLPYMANLSATLRGVSVDALQLYLDRLPSHAHHRKLNYAVTGSLPRPATLPVFFIHPSDITAFGLEDFLKGCNRVGEPHPLALSELARTRHAELLRTAHVPVLSLPELLLRAGACRLSLLKVDVEGLDAELMLSYAAFLWANPQCRADLLLFEERNLGRRNQTFPAMFKAVGAALRAVGYEAAFNPPGAMGFPDRDATWVWSAARDSRLWAARAALGGVAVAASGNAQHAIAAAPQLGLSSEEVDQLLLRGRGSEDEGEGEIGAAEADALFLRACSSVPVQLPTEPIFPVELSWSTLNAVRTQLQRCDF